MSHSGPPSRLFAPGLFKGKVVIVTGGGTGIGLAAALEMGRLGARIAIGSRKQNHVDAGLEKLREAGVESLGAILDIRDRASVDGFIKAVLDAYGTVDILINNAGGQFPAPAAVMEEKGWRAVIDTNLNGTWNMTQAVAKSCMLRRGGVIINIIVPTDRGMPGVSHTSAARAAVSNLTKSLATEWAQFGIRVVSLAPGTIDTGGLKQYPPPLIESLRKGIPWGRFGTPEEIAEVIAFLASPACDFCTGETFTVDGGARWAHPMFLPRKVQ